MKFELPSSDKQKICTVISDRVDEVDDEKNKNLENRMDKEHGIPLIKI